MFSQRRRAAPIYFPGRPPGDAAEANSAPQRRHPPAASPRQQLFHPGLQAVHRQGEHGEHPGDGVIGLTPVLAPGGPLAGVDPDDMGILVPEPLQPVHAALGQAGIPVPSVIPAPGQLIGGHLGIPHKNDLILRGQVGQQPLRLHRPGVNSEILSSF